MKPSTREKRPLCRMHLPFSRPLENLASPSKWQTPRSLNSNHSPTLFFCHSFSRWWGVSQSLSQCRLGYQQLLAWWRCQGPFFSPGQHWKGMDWGVEVILGQEMVDPPKPDDSFNMGANHGLDSEDFFGSNLWSPLSGGQLVFLHRIYRLTRCWFQRFFFLPVVGEDFQFD